MPRLWNVILALIVSGHLFLVLGSIEAGCSLSYTCADCRLARVDATLFVSRVLLTTRTNAAGGIQRTLSRVILTSGSEGLAPEC
jgi:hypothetical protein